MATTAMKKETSTTTEGKFPASSSSGEILDNVQGFAEDTYKKAKDIADNVVNDVRDVAANIPSTIRKYPVESMLVGFGAGFLVAFLGQRLLTTRD